METILLIVILVMSVVLHEVAHGQMADYLGDPTARNLGRLTLNPIPHLDMMGSVILPALMALSGTGFILGWAKPVPFNPMNIRNRRWGGALVALAGPVSNILLATIFGLVLRFGVPAGIISEALVGPMVSVVLINLVLAFFNLIPVPPLDGHHILFAILGQRHHEIQEAIQRYSFIVLIIVVFVAWRFIEPLVLWGTRFLVGF